MITRGAIRTEVMAILTGATVAGTNVRSPLDWDTYDGQYPVLLVRVRQEDGESLAKAAAQFTVTAEIQIVGRLEGPAVAGDADGGALTLEDQLEAFELQIKQAVINNPGLMSGLQQMSYFRTKAEFSGAGAKHLAEIQVLIGAEYYAGPEDFYPINPPALEDVRVNDPAVFDDLGPLEVEADIPIPH